uniref:Ubiquitin carboxyl-terminal hydrolase n=1 Tax=Schistocephalus solidus TaxID=70667 RepID=A0A0X3PI29_SCHSO
MDRIVASLIPAAGDSSVKIVLLNKVRLSLLTSTHKPLEVCGVLHASVMNLQESQDDSGVFGALCSLIRSIIENGLIDRRFFADHFAVSPEVVNFLCTHIPGLPVDLIVDFFVPSSRDLWNELQKCLTDHIALHNFPYVLHKVASSSVPLSTARMQLLDQSMKLYLENSDALLSESPVFSVDELPTMINFLATCDCLYTEAKLNPLLLSSICNKLSRLLLLRMGPIYSLQSLYNNENFQEFVECFKDIVTRTSQITYLPLASLIAELEIMCIDEQDAYEYVIQLCIEAIAGRLCDVEQLKTTILRLLTWSQWLQSDTRHFICADVWVIGILSEFGRLNSAVLCNNPNIFNELLLPILLKSLEIFQSVGFPSLPVIIIMSLILLVSTVLGHEEEAYSHCQILTSFLTNILSMRDSFLPEQLECTIAHLSKMGVLISTNAYNRRKLDGLAKNSKLLKLFDLIVRKFPPPKTCTVSDCLKAYKLENLVAAGAGAGLILRKSWSEETSQDGDQTKEPLLQLTFGSSTTKTIAKFPGLRNKGNTCYANAALQLLYHCSDFRKAVLSPTTFRCPPSTESAKAEYSLQKGDAESRSLWPLQNSCPQSFGRLHETLTQLFITLSTAKLQTAYDPSAVLTLSKPSHFVQGEQQDSAEYLNYLLDCLHEEELQSKRRSARVNQLKLMAEPSDDAGGRHQLFSLESSASSISSSDLLTPGTPSKPSERQEELMEVECLSSSNEMVECLPKEISERSIVRSLFGGTLSRRTICSQCNHVSSAELEDFICLFLPIETSLSSDCGTTSEKPPTNSATADIATLVETHFARSECVTGAGECEACGRESVRERQLSLRHLSPHVLIGLNLFTYNRTTQACHKVMRRIRINELLSVRVPKSALLSHQPSVPPPDISATETASTSTNQVIALDNEPHEERSSPSPAPDVTEESSIQVYKLQGMILHHGLSLGCGHYTCVAKVDTNWVSFDDCSTSFTSLDQINRQQFATPYLLLYSKV